MNKDLQGMVKDLYEGDATVAPFLMDYLKEAGDDRHKIVRVLIGEAINGSYSMPYWKNILRREFWPELEEREDMLKDLSEKLKRSPVAAKTSLEITALQGSGTYYGSGINHYINNEEE